MQCDQIRPLLTDYAERNLPTYKCAWVAQHLAGCQACVSVLTEQQRRLAQPVPAPAPGPVPAAVSRAELPARRQAPRWFWLAVAGLMLVTGALALYTFRPGRPVFRRPFGGDATERAAGSAPTEAVAEQGSLTFKATSQLQGDVSLAVDSMFRRGDEFVVRVQFYGRNLYAPRVPDLWATVMDDAGQVLPARTEVGEPDLTGLSAEIAFALPAGQSAFHLHFGEVMQAQAARWSLPLPPPPLGVKPVGEQLKGSPEAIQLVSYGQLSEMIQVELSADRPGLSTFPALYLRDGNGVTYAPITQMRTNGSGASGTILRYPLPKELILPLSLVGDGYLGKMLGPWTIDVNVIKS